MITLPVIDVSAGGAPSRTAALLVLPTTCWRCGATAVPIVGVLSSDRRLGQAGFVEFADVALFLASRVPESMLASLGIGPIKVRRSRLRPSGYLANGCVACDAILGDFPLREDLVTFVAEGGALGELAVARLVA